MFMTEQFVLQPKASKLKPVLTQKVVRFVSHHRQLFVAMVFCDMSSHSSPTLMGSSSASENQHQAARRVNAIGEYSS
jgi:hypothetical protein